MRKTDDQQIYGNYDFTRKGKHKNERNEDDNCFNIRKVAGSDFYGPLFNASVYALAFQLSLNTVLRALTVYERSSKNVPGCIRWEAKMYKQYDHIIKTFETYKDAV